MGSIMRESSDMSVYLELGPGALWGTVTGASIEVDYVENTLNEWAVQLGGRPAWVRASLLGEDGLVIMGGIVPVLEKLIPSMPQSLCPYSRHLSAQSIDADIAAFGEWLWEHQAQAVRAALMAPVGRGIIEVPTGGGKTRIAAAIAAVGGGEWLYVVPNKELLDQAEKTFIEANVIQGDSVEWSWTTYSQLYDDEDPGEYRGVIFDECHRIAADTWAQGAAQIRRSDYRIGLSGTPLDRCDDKNTLVIGLTGPVVFTVDLKELQKLGRLAQGEVEFIEVGT
jgi:hypothetical protein